MTNEQAVILEQTTQLQSQSSLWFKERKFRVTASKVSDVFHWKRGMDKHAEKFVNSDVLKVPEILQKKFDHGKMYEPVALENGIFVGAIYKIETDMSGLGGHLSWAVQFVIFFIENTKS